MYKLKKILKKMRGTKESPIVLDDRNFSEKMEEDDVIIPRCIEFTTEDPNEEDMVTPKPTLKRNKSQRNISDSLISHVMKLDTCDSCLYTNWVNEDNEWNLTHGKESPSDQPPTSPPFSDKKPSAKKTKFNNEEITTEAKELIEIDMPPLEESENTEGVSTEDDSNIRYTNDIEEIAKFRRSGYIILAKKNKNERMFLRFENYAEYLKYDEEYSNREMPRYANTSFFDFLGMCEAKSIRKFKSKCLTRF